MDEQDAAALAELLGRAIPDAEVAVRSKLAEVTGERDEALVELDRLHTWAGLMSLADEHYPLDMFPVIDDRPDAFSSLRIISLLRHLDQARAEVERLTDAAVIVQCEHPELDGALATIERARALLDHCCDRRCAYLITHAELHDALDGDGPAEEGRGRGA